MYDIYHLYLTTTKYKILVFSKKRFVYLQETLENFYPIIALEKVNAYCLICCNGIYTAFANVALIIFLVVPSVVLPLFVAVYSFAKKTIAAFVTFHYC